MLQKKNWWKSTVLMILTVVWSFGFWFFWYSNKFLIHNKIIVLQAMLVVLFTLQGTTLYNYYFSQSLNPSQQYYMTLVTNSTDLSDVFKMTNISYFLENEIMVNFFSNRDLTETSNVWVGPMQMRIVLKFLRTNIIF